MDGGVHVQPLRGGLLPRQYYAPGIGLVRDEDLLLVKSGFIRN
jgi:hypothetical protein